MLSQFNRKTTIETKAALVDLKSQGAKKIILDLRGNRSGLLDEAINVVNLFVDKGEVITTTKSVIEKYNQTYKTKYDLWIERFRWSFWLMDNASASEIVSGGLRFGSCRDCWRTVSERTRSTSKKLTYGTQLKVTISRYYTKRPLHTSFGLLAP